MKELCEEQNRTVVVVTHEPAVAVWAERIVVLKDGRTLTEFKTYPTSAMPTAWRPIIRTSSAQRPRRRRER